MAQYRVPFGGESDTASAPSAFTPGHALALAASALGGTIEEGTALTVATPWGALAAESRTGGLLVVATPTAAVAVPRVMAALAAIKLGLPKARVDASGMPIQVIDVGRAVLVVPVDDADAVAAVPADANPSAVPGSTATEGIVYARTQRTPYVKVLGRTLWDAEPLSALAAAAYHVVTSGGVRPTYPRTRVVGELVGHEGERAEITLEAREVAGGPKVERVFVGGKVGPA